ncbi:hypothetical protein BJV82DRAFT_670473 [Fennellomyces sp. T-0311]|nr:hypothetical protein BJV82DRAFT_670473 [Fennellomyces sp. T-0311]
MLYSNETTIMNLPNDIALLIVGHLDNADLAQCLRVSAVWHSFFCPFLYRTAKLTTLSKFCAFFNTIERSYEKTKLRSHYPPQRILNLGYNVRALHVRDGFMSMKRMEDLRTLCPNVTSIHFQWREKGNLTPESFSKPSTRVFETPNALFMLFDVSSLRSLSLTREGYDCRWEGMFTLDHLIHILRTTPQLESLTLDTKMQFITIASMELIHDTCPNLMQVSVAGSDIEAVNDETVIISAIEGVEPARRMENLSINGSRVWANRNVFTGPWFTYIRHKYPALRQLNISSREHDYRSIHADERDSQVIPAVAFRDYFPRLEELVLGAFSKQLSTAWPHLVRGIQKIKLRDNPSVFFPEWIHNEATNSIVQLSVWRFPSNLSCLKHCPHLQELELDSKAPESRMTTMIRNVAYNINIASILSCCPGLKKLTLTRVNICYEHASASQASLTTLKMNNVAILSNSVIGHVGQRCRELVHLDFYHCMWVVTDENPIIYIDLPQHRLSYFCMVEPQVYTQIPDSRPNRRLDVPIAPNRYIMLKTPGEANPRLFHDECRPTIPIKRYVQKINNSVIVRWLDAWTDGYEYEDDNSIQDQALKEMQDLRERRELNLPDERVWACTVLHCHSVDRLYYSNFRLAL